MHRNKAIIPTILMIDALSLYALYPEKYRFDVIGWKLNAYTGTKNSIVWVY